MADAVVPLAIEFAQRMKTAGIGPDNPAFAFLRQWNANAYRRAGAVACLCPHLAVEHAIRGDGSRGACQVIGRGGVRCGCARFTETEGDRQ